MNETPTTIDSAHHTILRKISRLRGLTIASVALSGLILFLFILACAAHHHHKKHDGDRGMGRHPFGMERGPGGWGGGRDFRGEHGPRGGRFGDERGGDFDRGQDRDGGPDQERGGMGRGPDGDGKRQPGTPEEMSTRMLDRLSKQLTLTEDEKAKIKPILLDQATQMQKDHEAQKQQMQKSMEDTKTKIRSFLTPDQQKQLDEVKMGHGGDKGESAPPMPPPAK